MRVAWDSVVGLKEVGREFRWLAMGPVGSDRAQVQGLGSVGTMVPGMVSGKCTGTRAGEQRGLGIGA